MFYEVFPVATHSRVRKRRPFERDRLNAISRHHLLPSTAGGRLYITDVIPKISTDNQNMMGEADSDMTVLVEVAIQTLCLYNPNTLPNTSPRH